MAKEEIQYSHETMKTEPSLTVHLIATLPNGETVMRSSRLTQNIMDSEKEIASIITLEVSELRKDCDKTISNEEVAKLKHGLYKIFWVSGAYSLAAVGSTYSGKRWYAPVHWTSEDHPLSVASTDWTRVSRVEEISVDFE
jgi:hypothetical protein